MAEDYEGKVRQSKQILRSRENSTTHSSSTSGGTTAHPSRACMAPLVSRSHRTGSRRKSRSTSRHWMNSAALMRWAVRRPTTCITPGGRGQEILLTKVFQRHFNSNSRGEEDENTIVPRPDRRCQEGFQRIYGVGLAVVAPNRLAETRLLARLIRCRRRGWRPPSCPGKGPCQPPSGMSRPPGQS